MSCPQSAPLLLRSNNERTDLEQKGKPNGNALTPNIILRLMMVFSQKYFYTKANSRNNGVFPSRMWPGICEDLSGILLSLGSVGIGLPQVCKRAGKQRRKTGKLDIGIKTGNKWNPNLVKTRALEKEKVKCEKLTLVSCVGFLFDSVGFP